MEPCWRWSLVWRRCSATKLTGLPAASERALLCFRVKSQPAAGVCTVELAAAASRVAPMLETARQRNLERDPTAVAPSDVDTSFDLLATTRTADEATERYGWVNPAALVLCALLALVLVVVVPLWQMRQQVIDLMPVETSARADAEIASAMQRQLDKQITEYNLPLASSKHSSPLAIQVLDDLSKRLPEDTWRNRWKSARYRIRRREIVLQRRDRQRWQIAADRSGVAADQGSCVQGCDDARHPNCGGAVSHIAGELVAAELPRQLQLSDAAVVTTVPVAASAVCRHPAGKSAVPAMVPSSGWQSAATGHGSNPAARGSRRCSCSCWCRAGGESAPDSRWPPVASPAAPPTPPAPEKKP